MRPFRFVLFMALLATLAACDVKQDLAASTAPKAAGSTLFAIDALVRSRELPGIDLHLRYAERTTAGLALHLAFYNNGTEDVALVSGADPRAARLEGAMPETPVARSPSFEATIAPETGWFVGGATNGTLTFATSAATEFKLHLPGFPPVPFRLDTPIRQAPEPAPAALGRYQFDFEVESARVPGLVLVVDRAAVAANKLDVELTLLSRGPRDIAAASIPRGKDAVLFDARWNQYRPSAADRALAGGTAEEGGLRPSDQRTGVLRFGRPVGDVALLKLPGFPLIRLPLRPDDAAAVATAEDLPPSADVRPALAAATPTPGNAARPAAAEARDLLLSLNRKLKARDRAGYLEAFAPALRDEQAQIFDRVVALPLADVTFIPGEDAGVLQGDALRGYHANWSYRVRDVDAANVFTARLELELRREGRRWQISRVGGEKPFWAFGPTEARRSGAFWIFYRPNQQAELPAIERESTAAFDQVNAALGERAGEVSVMFVTETADEFKALTGREPERFLGAALSRYIVAGDHIDVVGAAFYINGAAFAADQIQQRQQTIAHELTHLALARVTMPFTPLWLVEGAAMEVSRDLPEATMRDRYAAGEIDRWSLQELTARHSFATNASDDETAVDYAYAAYLARYLVETYGFDRFRAFYEGFANVPVESVRSELAGAQASGAADQTLGALATRLLPDQLRVAFGVEPTALERDFKRWLPGQLKNVN
jgi:hypothetical protein